MVELLTWRKWLLSTVVFSRNRVIEDVYTNDDEPNNIWKSKCYVVIVSENLAQKRFIIKWTPVFIYKQLFRNLHRQLLLTPQGLTPQVGIISSTISFFCESYPLSKRSSSSRLDRYKWSSTTTSSSSLSLSSSISNSSSFWRQTRFQINLDIWSSIRAFSLVNSFYPVTFGIQELPIRLLFCRTFASSLVGLLAIK